MGFVSKREDEQERAPKESLKTGDEPKQRSAETIHKDPSLNVNITGKMWECVECHKVFNKSTIGYFEHCLECYNTYFRKCPTCSIEFKSIRIPEWQCPKCTNVFISCHECKGMVDQKYTALKYFAYEDYKPVCYECKLGIKLLLRRLMGYPVFY